MTDFVSRFVTEPDPPVAHRRVNEAVIELLATAAPEQYRDPTPAGDWAVGVVVAHLSDVNDMFADLAENQRMPPPGPPSADQRPERFAESARRAERAFHAPGFLTEVRPTPIGSFPGTVVVQHVVNELITHAWDLARGLGAATDLVPDVAERSLASWRAFFDTWPRDLMTFNFDGERPPSDDATAADRLAAFLGRVT